MPNAQELKERIEQALPGAVVQVEDLTGGGDPGKTTLTFRFFVTIDAAINQSFKFFAIVRLEEIGRRPVAQGDRPQSGDDSRPRLAAEAGPKAVADQDGRPDHEAQSPVPAGPGRSPPLPGQAVFPTMLQ